MVSSPGGYTAMIATALLAVMGLGLHQAPAYQVPRLRLLLCLAVAAIASFPGARVWYLATHQSTLTFQHLLDLQIHGLSMLGGGLLAGAAGAAVCLFARLPVLKVADAITPGILVAMALMKLGCFLRGCCFGLPTELPWGVRFPLESPAALRQLEIAPWTILTGTAPIHPIQLYESVGYVTVAVQLLWMPKTSHLGLRACLGLAAMPVIHGSCLLLRDIPSASRMAMQSGLVVDLLILTTAVAALIHCWRRECRCVSRASLGSFRKTQRQH
jgi:prolipoprotein diacylglyceryltransferase